MQPSLIASLDRPFNPATDVRHDSGAYSTVTSQVIADNPDVQVYQTIERMMDYACHGARTQQIISTAVDALREANFTSGYEIDLLMPVWNYVKSRMSFVNDEVSAVPVQRVTSIPVVEVLIRPEDMHTWGIGDCDDYVTYGASILLAQQIPVSFATVAADRDVPNQYSHVYLVAYPKDATGKRVRVPMDLSHGKYLGWEVANRFGKMREWPVMCEGGLG